MNARFNSLPQSLQQQARTVRLGRTGIPALLVHPDWQAPAPAVVWLHGRSVNKELDPGRYLRWLRAGIAACAIDLPGHGERADPSFHSPQHTLDLLEAAIPEIDLITQALAKPPYQSLFDPARLALGGMSAGGMITLNRLTQPHTFLCASIEATTGSLTQLYFPDNARPVPAAHPHERVTALDPSLHLGGFRPIPLLALHSQADELIPFATQARFIDDLRSHYLRSGSSPDLIQFVTWPSTGAPQEHVGFGRYSNDAKNLQTDFLKRHLNPHAKHEANTTP